jgi:hypothetical protein
MRGSWGSRIFRYFFVVLNIDGRVFSRRIESFRLISGNMFRPVSVVFAALILLFASSGIAQEPPPAVEGFVTRAASSIDFDVNGFHVLSNSKTTFQVGSILRKYSTPADIPYIGEAASVSGKLDRSKRQIMATEIVLHPVAERKLSGFAVIDRILSPVNSTDMLIRADGYFIRINSTTKINFQAPLTSLANITTNVWIAFHGKLRDDGTVLSESAVFTPNIIHDREDKLLAKTDYDPSAVPDSSKQNKARELFFGIDPKKIPPWHDAAMQARISRIGASLVPSYQRALPDTDETKVLFQFQLIDAPKWHDARTMPSGVILIPRQIVERLQNDSQLATVLADNISCALEKQTYLSIPKNQALLPTNLAGSAAGLFVPGLGLITNIATYSSGKSIQNHLLEQSGRVSLGLLHDAGYDIHEAPMAWWTLAAKTTNDIGHTTPPSRALNLYRAIGETWRSPYASSASISMPTEQNDSGVQDTSSSSKQN